jgi:SAM-dependent MidA family methyltransferase
VKSSSPSRRISAEIRERGPITVAAFMELALYDPHIGYYARAAQRSGRAGDFFTSVDVGPIFGGLLEQQIAEMAAIVGGHTGPPLQSKINTGPPLQSKIADPPASDAALAKQRVRPSRGAVGADLRVGPRSDVAQDFSPAIPVVQDFSPAIPVVQDFSPAIPFDLVEAGAGNGRLSADILRAARQRDPARYDRLRLHLVEASAAARAAQPATLGDVGDRLVCSSAALPDRFEGVLIANELLDAFPVHQVVMREEGLREAYVVESFDHPASSGECFVLVEGPPSTPALQQYLDRIGVTLEIGWRAEINLRAVEWMRDAARRLTRGFIIVIDYGHEARQLYSASHADGTLTTFTGHTMAGPEKGPYPFSAAPPWLCRAGEQDITSHVDFTSVRASAEAEGLQTLLFLDQTYFLIGILESLGSLGAPANAANLTNLGLRTLLMPGGLGSTHKVLIFGKGVGMPALRGGSFGGRVT